MELPDIVITGIIACLSRRYIQVSFSTAHAFSSTSTSECETQAAASSSEESADSATQDFLFAEDYAVGCLVGLRARAASRDPQMRHSLLRHHTRAYYTGFSHCFQRISTLAAHSLAPSNCDNCLWRVVPDSYIPGASVTCQQCFLQSDSLQWGLAIPPVVLRMTTEVSE